MPSPTMPGNTWRRAVSISDSSRCCYWQRIDGLPFLLTLGAGAWSIPVGSILIVDVKDAEFDSMSPEQFDERWVDEADCTRNARAMQTLALIPADYQQWCDAWNGKPQEAAQ